MADKTSLGFVGYVLGGIMLAVTVIGSFVVTNAVNAKSKADGYAMATSSMAQSSMVQSAATLVSDVH